MMKELVLALVLALSVVSAQLDRDVMVEFYEATSAEFWIEAKNWNSSLALSEWYGLEGDIDILYRMDLGSNNLVGTLPSSLTSLSLLTWMDLSNNTLSGTLPRMNASDSTLEILNVADNFLTGPLDPWICAQLVDGNFRNNFWDCPVPYCCSSDSDLSTAACFYGSGSVTPKCTYYYNNTDERDALEQLYYELEGKNWTDNEHWLSDLPYDAWSGVEGNSYAVTEIDLRNNNLNGSLPTFLGSFPKMTDLDMSDNPYLVGELDSWITGARNLEALSISGCGLTGISDDLFTLPALQYIVLGDNNISGVLPSAPPSSTFLVEMDFTFNSLKGVLPDWICNITNGYYMDNFFDCPLPSCCQGPWLSVSRIEVTREREELRMEKESQQMKRGEFTFSPSPSPSPSPSCDLFPTDCIPSPSPSPSPIPSPSPTPTPSPSPVPSPTPSPSPTPTPSPSPVPSPTPSPSPTPTPSPSPVPSPSPTPTPSPSPVPSPSPTPTPSPSPVPSSFPNPSPSPFPAPFPSPTPTLSSPFPVPSPSPTPVTFPVPFPVPSPTPVRDCSATYKIFGGDQDGEFDGVELHRNEFVRFRVTAECVLTPSDAEYAFTYVNTPFGQNNVLSSGSLCQVSGVLCFGDTVLFYPSPSFQSGTIVTIESLVQFSFSDGTALEQKVSFRILVMLSNVAYFVEGGLKEGENGEEAGGVSLEGSFTNNNYAFFSPEYFWTCTPFDNQRGCPSCPFENGDVIVDEGTTYGPFSGPDLERDFSPPLGEVTVRCGYVFVSYVSIDNPSDIRRGEESERETTGVIKKMEEERNARGISTGRVVSDTIIVEHDPDAFIPDLQWTDASKFACTIELVPGVDLFISLAGFEVPDAVSTVSFDWDQIQGPTIECDGNGQYNCGGDNYPFVFIPADNLPGCDAFAFRVTVEATEGSDTGERSLETCPYRSLGRPQPGVCNIVSSDEDCAQPGSVVSVVCSGWTAECVGGSTAFTYEVVEQSKYVDDLFVRSISTTEEVTFLATADVDFNVRVCDSFGACTLYEGLSLDVCEVSNDDAREIAQNLMEQVEDCLAVAELVCAVDYHYAALDVLPTCDGGSNSELLNDAITQTNDIFWAYWTASDFDPTSLADLTTLVEGWAVLPSKSCEAVPDVLDHLSDVCRAPDYSGEILGAALNNLLAQALYLRQGDSKNFFRSFDLGLGITNCLDIEAGASSCGNIFPLTYDSGDTLSYYQRVFPLFDLMTAFQIQTTDATFFFPDNFAEQVEKAYKRQTGTVASDLWCVTFNLQTVQVGAEPQPEDVGSGTFEQAVYGLTVTFIIPLADGTYRSQVIQLRDLNDVYGLFYTYAEGDCEEDSDRKRRIEENNGFEITREKSKRFSLSKDGDEKVDHYDWVYYVYEGRGDSDGLIFLPDMSNECVKAYEILHFSNFGLLFSTSSADDWTTLRIVSVALFAATWFLLLLFFLFALYAPQSLRGSIGLLSNSEQADQQLSGRH